MPSSSSAPPPPSPPSTNDHTRPPPAATTAASPAPPSPFAPSPPTPTNVQQEPVPLIIDSDMSFDVDDVGAACLAHALVDAGEVDLLATIFDTGYPHGVGMLSVIAEWYTATRSSHHIHVTAPPRSRFSRHHCFGVCTLLLRLWRVVVHSVCVRCRYGHSATTRIGAYKGEFGRGTWGDWVTGEYVPHIVSRCVAGQSSHRANTRTPALVQCLYFSLVASAHCVCDDADGRRPSSMLTTCRTLSTSIASCSRRPTTTPSSSPPSVRAQHSVRRLK